METCLEEEIKFLLIDWSIKISMLVNRGHIMPKIGMEAQRRKSLINAAIETIHDHGFCDATVNRNAKRAGVSSGLAHHYFGSKSDLLAATMRSLLNDLGDGVKQKVAAAETPRARISAIISSNFSPEQFQPSVVAAWLAFYVPGTSKRSKQTSPENLRQTPYQQSESSSQSTNRSRSWPANCRRDRGFN